MVTSRKSVFRTLQIATALIMQTAKFSVSAIALFSTVKTLSVIMLSTPMAPNRLISRIAATLFIVGGACLTLASLLGAPSFWYIPCVCALIPLGFVWWFCPPSLAAGLSIGPLVAAVALLRYLSGMWLAVLVACLIAAVTLILAALRSGGGRKLPLSISLVYLVAVFLTDRLFTSKVKV